MFIFIHLNVYIYTTYTYVPFAPLVGHFPWSNVKWIVVLKLIWILKENEKFRRCLLSISGEPWRRTYDLLHNFIQLTLNYEENRSLH